MIVGIYKEMVERSFFPVNIKKFRSLISPYMILCIIHYLCNATVHEIWSFKELLTSCIHALVARMCVRFHVYSLSSPNVNAD